MKFNSRKLYSLPVLLTLLTSSLVSDYFCSSEDPCTPFKLIFEATNAVFTVLAFVFILKYSSFFKGWYLIVLAYFSILVLESLYTYNTFFIYPHVLKKIMVYFTIFAIYGFFKYTKKVDLNFICNVLLILFTINALTVNVQVFSFSAFSETERGFPAETVLMLVFPMIFYLNKFFETSGKKYLFFTLVTMALILFLQHRTVWVTATFALIINYFVIKYKSEAKITYSFFFNFGFISLTFLIFGILTIVEFKPEFLDILSDRAMDIIQPNRAGSTSSWRLLQYISYLPFIEDNIWIGMRFSGFELPIQFYHPEAGLPYFEDNSGHHFHSYYVDILFYFGISGILLQVIPTMLYLIRKTLSSSKLSVEQISLTIFSLSGFIFGISYNLPAFYFAFLGLTFFYMDRTTEPKEESKDNQNIKHTASSRKILTKA